MTDQRVLVPISDSVTVRQTVGYAIQAGFDAINEHGDGRLQLHLIASLPHESNTPEGVEDIESLQTLLERASVWAREDVDDLDRLEVQTNIIGTDSYLFAPRDYAIAFTDYCDTNDIDFLVLDPEYQPGISAPLLQPLERELQRRGVSFIEARVERPARHERLVGRDSTGRRVSLFLVSYAFYLMLGNPTYWFDLVTGAAVATIVALTLSHVTFSKSPTISDSPIRNLRFALYVPYLFYQILLANVLISIVILRPSMPIEPKITRVRARVRSGLPLFALANSITLTPGTLTVRANDQRLVVHSLIPRAHDGLVGGSLERAVRFVFHGRRSMRVPSPIERGDVEELDVDDL